VDAIARLAQKNLLGDYRDEPDDDDSEQYKVIQECLKSAGAEVIFNSEPHKRIWAEDLTTLLRQPDGKAQLLAKMRSASQVPSFKQLS
jgi:hypothetical protein